MKIIGDENIVLLREAFSRLGQVTALPTHKITNKTIQSFDALLVRSVTTVNKKLLAGTNVKFVGTASAGTDHIDIEYLKSRGITFASAPGSNSNAVAEYVVAALLVLARKKALSIEGSTIGIIGVGNVGSKVVKKCQALGLRTLLNDPPLARKTGDKKYLPISALFDADILTLHVPLTYEGIDATYHMVNNEFLRKMKPGAILINTSRGGVVDERALLKAINKFSAVVLDVWEGEPNINCELLSNTTLATPHIAGYSLDGKLNATAMLYDALCKFTNKRERWSPLSHMKAPEKEVIEVDVYCNTQIQIIEKIVKRAYDFEADDRKLRKILQLPCVERGKYFNSLRQNYKFRREFHNTKILIPDLVLRNKLRGLGFLCSSQGIKK